MDDYHEATEARQITSRRWPVVVGLMSAFVGGALSATLFQHDVKQGDPMMLGATAPNVTFTIDAGKSLMQNQQWCGDNKCTGNCVVQMSIPGTLIQKQNVCVAKCKEWLHKRNLLSGCCSLDDVSLSSTNCRGSPGGPQKFWSKTAYATHIVIGPPKKTPTPTPAATTAAAATDIKKKKPVTTAAATTAKAAKVAGPRGTCASCVSGSHLNNNECKPNVCQCPHGTAATGSSCPHDGDTHCSSCAANYRKVGAVCKRVVCHCLDGRGARGAACPSHNAFKCSSCNADYHLVGIKCDPDYDLAMLAVGTNESTH